MLESQCNLLGNGLSPLAVENPNRRSEVFVYCPLTCGFLNAYAEDTDGRVATKHDFAMSDGSGTSPQESTPNLTALNEYLFYEVNNLKSEVSRLYQENQDLRTHIHHLMRFCEPAYPPSEACMKTMPPWNYDFPTLNPWNVGMTSPSLQNTCFPAGPAPYQFDSLDGDPIAASRPLTETRLGKNKNLLIPPSPGKTRAASDDVYLQINTHDKEDRHQRSNSPLSAAKNIENIPSALNASTECPSKIASSD
eukprot:Platyproteum_vivax@DN10512_c0_g1_i1.p1